MPEPTSPPPPPPATTAYQPTSGYPAAPAAAAPVGVKMPSWMDFGILIMGVGALLTLFGFLLGAIGVGQFPTSGTSGSLSNFQSDLEFFFVLSGIGVFLMVGGGMFRVMNPLWKAEKGAKAAAAPARIAAPPAPVPAAAPAAPICPTCGKPTTYLAQYGRYYCYTDARYV